MATAMARSHMRSREVSPMFTQSETAPMVQKRVLLPTAPKMKARMKAPPVTNGTSAAGLASFKESTSVVPAKAGTYDFRERNWAPLSRGRRFRRNSTFGEGGEALLGARGGAAFRVPVDEVFEGLLRVLALAHGLLRARNRQHGVGRLFTLRPGGEELPLRGDRLLVVAAS